MQAVNVSQTANRLFWNDLLNRAEQVMAEVGDDVSVGDLTEAVLWSFPTLPDGVTTEDVAVRLEQFCA